MGNLHAHAIFFSKKQESLIAKITTRKPKNAETVFEKDEMELCHKNGDLYLHMPTLKFLGRRTRRFLRDYVASLGGIPRSLHYWLVPYR